MKIKDYKVQHLGVAPNFRKHVVGTTSIDSYIRYGATWDFEVFLPTIGKNLQRGLVWDIDQKREFIRSVIFERTLPLACIVLHQTEDKNQIVQVIDGKQRITTLLSFIANEFDVDGYYCKDFGHEFVGLVKFNALVYYSYYDEPITDEQKIYLFKQINFAGTPQDKEHLNTLKP